MSSKLDPFVGEILERHRAGDSQRVLAKEYGVARSTLQHFLDKHESDGRGHAYDGLSEDPSEEFIEIPVFERHYPDHDHLYVYPLGDVHKGSPAHAEDRWHEWIGYLESEPNCSMLGTGDFLNTALKTSKSESYDEETTVGVAKRQVRKELAKLAEQDKIDLLMPGNHEARYYRAVGDCPIEDIADALGVHYARVAAVIVYYVGNVRYEVSVRHGKGGGEVGARATRLAKQARTLLADIYVSGHTHSQLSFPQDLFVVEDGRVTRRRQLFISSGSFLNYEAYAAEAGYPPQKIGAPRIRLDGTRKDAHVSI